MKLPMHLYQTYNVWIRKKDCLGITKSENHPIISINHNAQSALVFLWESRKRYKED